MAVFLLLAGSLTCGFFLNVLVQFQHELRRRQQRISLSGKAKARHSPKLRFRSLRKASNESSFTQRGNAEEVSLLETPIQVMVPRDT